jgi:hypothetical protein
MPMSSRHAPIVIALAALAIAPPLAADPYRLRADALATVQSPAGLVVLQAEGKQGERLGAEALVWLGAGEEDEAQALVVAVRAREDGLGDARLGRFVVTAGGLRPQHIDGAHGRVRLPYRLALESFIGSPVASGDDGRGFDWVAGTRASRQIGTWGSTGVAYMHRRDAGRLAAEEVAFDASVAATEWLDLSARAALDLIKTGLSETQGLVGTRFGDWRVELYGVDRSPSRLLPATSLFSVLGDMRSRRLGAQVRWRAAPRLDLFAEGGALGAADQWGELMATRATLRLDDRGDGALGGELRREWAPDGGWNGARATLRLPLYGFVVALEGELAFPEHANGDGSVWPWGLAALSRRFGTWEAAAALEASSSSDYVRRVDGLARLTWLWEAP